MKRFYFKFRFLFLSVMLAVIPRILLCINTFPVRTISDEVSNIANAAYLAGYDWSGVLENAGYYGSGMTALFTPILQFVDNPIWAYRIMLICESLFYGVIAAICFYILKVYFEIHKEIYCCIVSVACSYVVAVRTMVVYNEHMLTLITWLLVLLLLHGIRNNTIGKKNVIPSIFCAVILAYAMLVHTRGVIFWAAIVAALLGGRLLYKKWILSPGIIILFGGCLSIIVRKINNYMQSEIWLKQSGETLRNAEVQASPLIELLRPRTWHAWGNIFIGQIQTMNVLTCGVFLFALFLSIFLYVRRIKIWKKEIVLGKEKERRENKLVILSIFCIVGIIITILGQVLTWGIWASDGMSLGLPSPSYSQKAFTYVRYFAIFCGPFFMFFWILYFYKREWIRKCFKYYICFLGGILFYWFCAVIPFIYQNNTLTEVYIPFALWNESKEIGIGLFLPGTIISIFITISFYFFSKRKKIYIPIVVVTALLLFQYCYNAIIYDYNNAVRAYEDVNASYSLINGIKNKQNIPEDIYVYDTSGVEDHQNYMIYQYMFKDCCVIPGVPDDENLKEVILFSNGDLRDFWDDESNYQMAQLDENEYIYVKGDNLVSAIEEYGINLN